MVKYTLQNIPGFGYEGGRALCPFRCPGVPRVPVPACACAHPACNVEWCSTALPAPPGKSGKEREEFSAFTGKVSFCCSFCHSSGTADRGEKKG